MIIPPPQRPPSIHIILLAGGRGMRMGGDIPKQYQSLGGVSLLRRSALRLAHAILDYTSMVVVAERAHMELARIHTIGVERLTLAAGGPTRQQSVKSGLQAIQNTGPDDLVLIHDSARPLVHAEDIGALLDALSDQEAATLAAPVHDTLRRTNTDGRAAETVPREHLWALQTPQAFRLQTILNAHESLEVSDTVAMSDDSQIASDFGIEVKLVPAHYPNFKITTAQDLLMAEAYIYNNNSEIRTGIGFDVHAFEPDKTDRVLKLCGVQIPHDRALAGHSDADVALHAITDALLGAIGAGDIGDHFPPSDSQWKDCDSAYFLKKALEIGESQNCFMVNLDCTIICEKPKISKYKVKMQERLTEILNLEKSRINIKATTTEGLGFTGRGEGIAAQAVITIRKELS